MNIPQCCNALSPGKAISFQKMPLDNFILMQVFKKPWWSEINTNRIVLSSHFIPDLTNYGRRLR
jgi:hypothetical protein